MLANIQLDYKDLGRQIQLRRKQLNLTQEQLAEKIPCSLTHLCRIERGNKPGLEVLIRIATLLNISLDDLFCLFMPRDTTLMEIQRLLANRTPAEKRKALDILTALFQDSRSTPPPSIVRETDGSDDGYGEDGPMPSPDDGADSDEPESMPTDHIRIKADGLGQDKFFDPMI